MNINKLPKRPMSYQEILRQGITRHYLKQLISEGAVERIDYGIYQVARQAEGLPKDQYMAATLKCGLPSSVCLLSALDHYNLTDQIPKKVWMLVPNNKRIRSKDLKLIRSRSPKWNIGIKKLKGYWITTIERTLIDCLIYKRLIGSQVALSALKRSVVQKKIKLSNLYNMGKKLKVEHRIRSYIETLANE